MFRLLINATLLLSLSALALPNPNPNPNPLATDPSGDKNIGNGQGEQFITGACLSDADCQSECCATFSGGGICSAKAVANVSGKEGCGFNAAGNGTVVGETPSGVETPAAETPAAETPANGTLSETPSATPAATTTPASVVDGVDPDAAGAANVGTGEGKQFITGQCLSDADCASGCCAGREGSDTAACSAKLAANEGGKTGCGFVQ